MAKHGWICNNVSIAHSREGGVICRVLGRLELIQQAGVGAGRSVGARQNVVWGDANISPHRVAKHRRIATNDRGGNARGDCAVGLVKRAASLFAMEGAV